MAKPKEELTFEENLARLEEIVNNLESGNIPLDDAIHQFTEATKIAKLCDEKLKKAEATISKIVNKDGHLEDFHMEETEDTNR
ncbi:MAG: exodeoxyribonuclease VII small subunit [bacterium]|nr:exodeoxyribonuclease VII small subunit [bacterium]